jgi:hypothetical protein
MKNFQVLNHLCYNEVTDRFPTVESTVGFFPPDVLFVNAPDYVFEGWGYDATKDGDDRFIKPTAPEGWIYDGATGTFYEEGYVPEPSTEEILLEIAADHEARLCEIELGV